MGGTEVLEVIGQQVDDKWDSLCYPKLSKQLGWASGVWKPLLNPRRQTARRRLNLDVFRCRRGTNLTLISTPVMKNHPSELG